MSKTTSVQAAVALALAFIVVICLSSLNLPSVIIPIPKVSLGYIKYQTVEPPTVYE